MNQIMGNEVVMKINKFYAVKQLIEKQQKSQKRKSHLRRHLLQKLLVRKIYANFMKQNPNLTKRKKFQHM